MRRFLPLVVIMVISCLLSGCGQVSQSDVDMMNERAKSRTKELVKPEDCIGMNLEELDRYYKVSIKTSIQTQSFSELFERMKVYSGDAVVQYAFQEAKEGTMTMRRNKGFKAKVEDGVIKVISDKQGYPPTPWPGE